MTRALIFVFLFASLFTPQLNAARRAAKHRNVIIFVADGLRPGSVNATDAPTLLSIRQKGVFFANSHSMFPTFTTANAATIATGHYLGDTGDFSNTVYSGYPVFDTGNFGKSIGTVTPFVENDQILADLDDHYQGNYLNEETLLSLGRKAGFNTASIGKLGPVAIQDVTQLDPASNQFQVPQTVIIDDATGSASGVPLRSDIINALTSASLGTVPTPRNQPSGSNTTPGTLSPNTGQQQWFADATTKAVLPTFKSNGKPFLVLFWSRDPDGTQHNQGDSLNSLTPGINGPTSKAAIRNADNNLKQILDYINGDPDLAANTDVFVTADHGFATISKRETDSDGTSTKSYAAGFTYKNASGVQEVNTGFLPVGFLAIDIAHAVGMPLYDPDNQITVNGAQAYEPVDPTVPQQTATVRQHSGSGNGLIGGTGAILEHTDAKVIVAANGGSDLIYVPDHSAHRVREIVNFLVRQDYVGGLFVDDSFGDIPGALPLSTIGLVGSAKLPTPTIAVNFKTFVLDRTNPLMTAVQIADSSLQEGQGMHGTLSRDDTFNNMAAIGPDFKKGFVDDSPVSNADIARTLAAILAFHFEDEGVLQGRVAEEALSTQRDKRDVYSKVDKLVSKPSRNGKVTVLKFQRHGAQRYFDSACLADVKNLWSSWEDPCK